MRWWVTLSVTGLGAVVAIGGLLYGVLSVGVPHPEPTLPQAAAEKANLAISHCATGCGMIVFATGVIMLLALAIVRVVARATNHVMH